MNNHQYFSLIDAVQIPYKQLPEDQLVEARNNNDNNT